MSEKKWYKISMDTQDSLVYLILIILCGAVVIQPLGLPLNVTAETKQYYETLRNVPEGRVILYDQALMVQSYVTGSEITQFRIIFDLIRTKHIKFIVLSSCVDGPLGGAFIEKLLKEGVDLTGTTYGVDYVNLGWLPGFELVLAAVAKDIQTVTAKDAYGTPISDIPLMKGLKTSDIDLFAFSCGVSADPWMRQWGSLGKPILMSGGEQLMSLSVQYYKSGLVTGYINGSRGYAELEQIYGKYTVATALMDATNLVSIYGIALIVLSATMFWYSRRKK